MTTNYPPDPNVGIYAPQKSPRPTILTVAAIIGIVWAALGLLCAPAALIPLFADFAQEDPAMQAMKEDRAIVAWSVVQAALSFALALLLLVSSIGALMLKRWSRTGMFSYAIGAILMLIVGMVLQFTWIMPKVQQAQQDQFAAIGGLIGAIIGLVIGLAVPIFELIAFTRPGVKQALGTP